MLAQSMTKGGTGAGRQFLEVRDNDCGDDARAGRWMRAAVGWWGRRAGHGGRWLFRLSFRLSRQVCFPIV